MPWHCSATRAPCSSGFSACKVCSSPPCPSRPGSSFRRSLARVSSVVRTSDLHPRSNMKTLISPRSIMPRAMAAAVVFAGLAACSGESKPTDQTAPNGPAASASASAEWAAGPLNADPGGKVIAVNLTTDGAGNYFTPAEVHARPGDVVRFNLKVGVHNIHFLADSNAGRSGYPQAASDFLQLPGQTWDMLVRLPKGTYYFQCDPHAALGMKGHLIVE